MYRVYNSFILAIISHTSFTLMFSFMLAKSHAYRYVICTKWYCTNIRRSTESRQGTLAECCEQGNELSRYIQGLICLSKKLLLHCSYKFTRSGKFTKRNINLFMSVCLSVRMKYLGSDWITSSEYAQF
jgi:hypothetical protein